MNPKDIKDLGYLRLDKNRNILLVLTVSHTKIKLYDESKGENYEAIRF